MHTVYPILLSLHMVGFVLFIGTAFTDYLLFRKLRQAFFTDSDKAFFLYNIKNKISRNIHLAGILAVVSGVAMMAATKGIYSEQLWFQIKFPLAILSIVLFIISTTRQRKWFNHTFKTDVLQPSERVLMKFFAQQHRFYIIVMLILAVILIVSAFRF